MISIQDVILLLIYKYDKMTKLLLILVQKRGYINFSLITCPYLKEIKVFLQERMVVYLRYGLLDGFVL